MESVGVRETCCTRCRHCDVCRYKETLLKVQFAVDNVTINDTKVSAFEYFMPIEVRCKYFFGGLPEPGYRKVEEIR